MQYAIPERLLHFIWQFSIFKSNSLKLSNGSGLVVTYPGAYHQDSGPDFIHAKIDIDGTSWFGNVEIHIKSSDWYKHNHQTDEAYNSVILHVVLEHDQEVFYPSGNPIPVLELKNYIKPNLLERWKVLNSGFFEIPCQEIGRTDILTMNNWMDRLVVERLQIRSDAILEILKSVQYNWQETFHIYFCKSIGMGVNSIPFEVLARKTPFSLLYKYKHSVFQLEALLFGGSGLLPEEPKDLYTEQLIAEYDYLRAKHRLSKLEPQIWKFMRMRPVNFPTLRIAQLASVYSNVDLQLMQLIELDDIATITKKLKSQPSEYWNDHYHFNEKSPPKKKSLGMAAICNVIINAIIPVVFEYARFRSNQELKDKCLDWLYAMKAESNSIVRKWKEFGIHPDSAANTQALIQLKKHYCDKRKCLNCSIGHKLLTCK